MNAVSLYVTASRMIFSSLRIDDPGKWSDINRLIVFLRQSLTCCVCGNLLRVPMSSPVAPCQHHVCAQCIGGKMRLKPSCSSCKDHTRFVQNVQLRVLLQCYKKLCTYVSATDVPNKWGQMTVSCANGPTPAAVSASASHGIGALISGPTTFFQLIEEGANLSDKFAYNGPSSSTSLTGQSVPAIRPKPGPMTAAPAAQPVTGSKSTGKSAAVGAAAALVAKAQAQLAAKRSQAPAAAPVKRPKHEPSTNTPAVLPAIRPAVAPLVITGPEESPPEQQPVPEVAEAATRVPESRSGVTAKELDHVAATAAVATVTRSPAVAASAAAVVIPNPQLGPEVAGATIADLKQKLLPVIDIKIPDAATVPPVAPVPVTPGNQQLVVPPVTGTTCSTPQSGTSGNGSKKPAAGQAVSSKRRGCRCGLATPNPGKLTCCGQRCPCYVDGKGCFDCKCRGCRNPHKANTNSGITVTPAVKPNLQSVVQTPVACDQTLLLAQKHLPHHQTGSQKQGKEPVDQSPRPVHAVTQSATAVKGTSVTVPTAAIMNTLQSNGVTCKIITVATQAGGQPVGRSLHQANRPATITLTTGGSNGGNTGYFLSPSICLINHPNAGTTQVPFSLPVDRQ